MEHRAASGPRGIVRGPPRDDLALAQPLVSHHLRALRQAGVVRTERCGAFTYYVLDRAVLTKVASAPGQLGSAPQSPSRRPCWRAPRCPQRPCEHAKWTVWRALEREVNDRGTVNQRCQPACGALPSIRRPGRSGASRWRLPLSRWRWASGGAPAPDRRTSAPPRRRPR
ncbi:MAG: transcriptional regulator [Acidimicrobiia bacterium]|nr:transcriptional regulator [Acidimicrobiia bacterium]